jgi:hypothetical protein
MRSQLVNMADMIAGNTQTKGPVVLVPRLSYINSSLQNTRRLIAQIPADADLDRMLVDASNRYSSIAGQNEMQEEGMEMGGASINLFEMLNDMKHEPNKALGDAAWYLNADSTSLERLSNEIADRAFSVSERFRIQLKRTYDRATFLSYALYTLGWSIALIGRICGVETPTGFD